MDTFTVRDLREHTGSLIHEAEAGKLSLITKHGRPVFLAVPFTSDLVEFGLRTSLAIKLFKEDAITLEKAAKIAGVHLEIFIERLGQLGIPAVDYPVHELSKELKDFD
jgi:prevent-host-death family protein